MSLKVIDLELKDEMKPLWGDSARYEGLRILVRYNGQPAGWVTVENIAQDPIPAEQLKKAINEQIGHTLNLIMSGGKDTRVENELKTFPSISVIICTRDRTDLLSRCIQGLFEMDYPQYEVIVIDNAPSSDATASLVSTLPGRYFREDLPGLDRARNAGIAQARYDIIAFIDDDAIPDPGWLGAIARAFEDPQVMAVTGLVAPVELETEAQILFEFVYGGMGHGFQTRRLNRESLAETGLLWASNFGVGANMAFRREVFHSIGLFDPALDVGTPSGGGGDVEIFHRLVAAGHTLVYEPAVLVWHLHRRQMAMLKRLVFNNGRSFGAYLLTASRRRTVHRSAIVNFAVKQWLLAWLLYRLTKPGKFPRSLVLVELLGALISPVTYLLAQAKARRLDSQAGRGEQVMNPMLN